MLNQVTLTNIDRTPTLKDRRIDVPVVLAVCPYVACSSLTRYESVHESKHYL